MKKSIAFLLSLALASQSFSQDTAQSGSLTLYQDGPSYVIKTKNGCKLDVEIVIPLEGFYFVAGDVSSGGMQEPLWWAGTYDVWAKPLRVSRFSKPCKTPVDYSPVFITVTN